MTDKPNHPPCPAGPRFLQTDHDGVWHFQFAYGKSTPINRIATMDSKNYHKRDCANEACETIRAINANNPDHEAIAEAMDWQDQWRAWRDGKEWR